VNRNLGSFACLALLGATSAAFGDQPKPDFVVDLVQGPPILKAGLSGTFNIKIRNTGSTPGPLEVFFIFAGKLDQTDQIRADSGMACEVRHDKGINAAVYCTGGKIEPGQTATFTLQGRGESAGVGHLVTTINPSHSLPEGSYDNNFSQVNVSIE
jgi:hypothetical protein